MKKQKGITIFELMITIIAVVIGTAYVVAHFISKFW